MRVVSIVACCAESGCCVERSVLRVVCCMCAERKHGEGEVAFASFVWSLSYVCMFVRSVYLCVARAQFALACVRVCPACCV